jgi:LysM repeat protein
VPQATPRSYVVQEGDTLSAIAARFGTTVGAIQAANGLGQSDLINVGQVLIIP